MEQQRSVIDRWGRIAGLSHVAFQVPDIERSVWHATRIVGLRESGRGDGTVYLTAGRAHHELQLIQSDRACSDHVAFHVTDREALDEFRAALEAQGIATQPVRGEIGLSNAFRFAGPSGHVFELLLDMEANEPEFYNTEGIRPNRLEHVGLRCENVEEMVQFFTRVMGFRVSDRMDTDAYVWMRCNAYHHSIGFIKGRHGFHHYAWETMEFNDYRRLGDHLRANRMELLWGVGRHGPGHNIFAYYHDADRAVVEYSGDLQRIVDERTYVPGNWPKQASTGTVWGGLAPNLPEFLALGVDSVRQDAGAMTASSTGAKGAWS